MVNIQHDPAFEWLIEIDPDTGNYVPWLADSWTMAPDGRSWTIQLHKGVHFQHGYGEFTAKDVVHNHALWCDATYPGRKDPPFTANRNGICAVTRMDVVHDYELVMHCKVVCLDMPFYYSDASNVIIFSKAQWDKEGEQGYETHPPGQAHTSSKSANWAAMCCTSVAPCPTGNAARSTGKNCR